VAATLQAGFAERDITPPIGSHKIGWMKDIVVEAIHDPLHVRAAVFERGDDRIGFVQLDTLSVRWTTTQDIRRRIEAECGFPGDHVMVSATHNHGGPAVANCGDVPRDDAYVEEMTRRCVRAFGQALDARRAAQLGFQHVYEFDVAANRRVVMRDGTVRTHAKFTDPDALYMEGPIDPEVAVLAARDADGALLGALVNFACHPTHLGGGTEFTGGYPGVLAGEMKKRGCPVTVFLTGACGNVSCEQPAGRHRMTMEEAGARLAEDAWRAIEAMTFSPDSSLGAVATTVTLPYRAVSEEEVKGTVRGAQRFVDPALYDKAMPALQERIRARGEQPAEVQTLFLGNVAIVGIPAEYFVEHGLRIKTSCHPRHALVAAQANGMVGYVPTREAFERGGYETTFAPSSRLAPEAGDLLADAAIRLIQQHQTEVDDGDHTGRDSALHGA